jgi:hypothetical protein
LTVFRFIRAVLGALLLLGCLAAAAIALLFLLPDGEGRPASLDAPQTHAQTFVARLKPQLSAFPPFRPIAEAIACAKPGASDAAARANAAGMDTAQVSPFGKTETGWAVYGPLIEQEVGTVCAPNTAGFAATLAIWQSAHSLQPSGEVDAPTLSALSTIWLLRRPFVLAMRNGCPPSPNEQTLARAGPSDALGAKPVLARPAALDAYRRMVAAERSALGTPPPILTISSAYRDPTEEATRCADGGCGGPAKAHCSAHRTGLAFDLYLDAQPGPQSFSTSDEDRLRLSRTPAYRWLVRNAARFGFVPYPFEPWHWEWTGEPV